jgi:glycosyltransferase involved in cell wall biosynthesis
MAGRPLTLRARRLLYVTSADLAREAGDAEHVRGLCGGLAAFGYDVRLVARARAAEVGLSPAMVHHLVAIRREPGGMRGLLETLRSLGVLVAAARRALARVGPVDAVYLRPFMPGASLLARHVAARSVPYVCELNTMVDAEAAAQGRPWRGRMQRLELAAILRRSTAWIGVTQELASWAAEIAGCERPSAVTGNGFDAEEIRLSSRRREVRWIHGVPDALPVLAMAGCTEPWHGADRALAMLAAMRRPAELWLIGAAGPARRRLEALAEQLGVRARVRIFPWCEKGELADLLAASDVGIGSLAFDRNRMQEAQSLKVRAYLGAGRPVLLNHRDSRVGQALPYVCTARTTVPEELAGALEAFLDRGAHDAAAIRRFATARLTWRAVAEETAAFLDEVLPLEGRGWRPPTPG